MAALGLGAPLWLAATTGSLQIPHNDSWAYSKIAEEYARTGRVELLGWNRGALLGQVFLVGPLGRWILAQHLVVLALGLGAAGLTFALVSQISGRATGVLAAGLLIFFPGYALLSLSFMEDVPAYFAIVGCLLLGQTALRTGRLTWLASALVVGTWGFTIREQAVAAPVAVLTAMFWRHRRVARTRIQLYVAGALLLLALVAFEVVRGRLAYADPIQLSLEGPSVLVHRSFRAYYTLALVVAPAVVAQLSRVRLSRRQLKVAAVVAVLELALFLQAPGSRGFFGNYLAPEGSYAIAHNGSNVVLPDSILHLLEACALASGALIPVLVQRYVRELGPLLSTFGLLTVAGTGAQIMVGQTVFDRYLVVLIPVLVVALGPVPRPRGGLRAAAAAVPLVLVSLALTANALSRDGAEWQQGRSLVSRGVAASDIDAGFSWVGYHADGPAQPERLRTHPTEPFYLALFPASRACYSIALVKPYTGTVIATSTYRTYGVVGKSTLFVSRQEEC